jgi:cytochrome c5
MKNRAFTILAGTLMALTIGLGMVVTQESAVAQEAAAAEPDPMQFARGAQSWANNCARCHNMRDPKELRDDQWRAAVGHMRVRAGLTGQEARDILVFLQGSN